MQQYPKKSKNGDAGEYFAAYKFTKLFAWPYRMLDVDLGVDAEIEILNDDGISTSNLIKLQIKTFDHISSEESKRIYVSAEHIAYWKKFCLPIVIVCIDLAKEKVYWKPVTATESYQSGGYSNVISINLTADELTAASKHRFVQLATPEASREIEPRLDAARVLYRQLDGMSTFAVDGDQLGRIEQLVSSFHAAISHVEEIIKHFPWRVGLLTLREIEMMKYNVRVVQNDANHSYAVGVNGM